MRVMILGGTGMLGHRAWQVFAEHFETYTTIRAAWADCPHARLFDRRRTLDGVAADSFDRIERALSLVRPEAVVNCIGIVKQQEQASDAAACIMANAYFPHRLAQLCRSAGCRLIHISTDCVFSGSQGHYREDDRADAADLYGRSKLLGEVAGPGCLTIRTSMIGPELGRRRGLLEWFLAQEGGSLSGYTHAIFSGLTTDALADHLVHILRDRPDLEGTWHLAGPAISKYDLLCLIKQAAGLQIAIQPDDSVNCDRSLDDRRFRARTGLPTPSWHSMVHALCRGLAKQGKPGNMGNAVPPVSACKSS